MRGQQRRIMRIRKGVCSAVAVLVAAGLAVAAGRPGMLKTKTGIVYEGVIDEREQSVLVNVRGIETNIPRDSVESIAYGDFETRWTADYGKLAADDDKGRVKAARAAFEVQRYDLAENALRAALAIQPNNAEAAEMLQQTMRQRRLEQTKPAAGDTPNNNGGTPAPHDVKSAGQYNTLTPDDINRVRQLEIRQNDAKVKFRLEKNVLKRYWDANPILADTYKSYGEFSKAQTQAAMMIIKDGGEMAKDVKVANDPEVFVEFRNPVLPLVLRGCATSACHGGNNDSTKRFALILPGTDPAQAYTNFFLNLASSMSKVCSRSTNIMNVSFKIL